MAARLGGDEFVLLIAPLHDAADRGEAGTIKMIHALRATLERPLRVKDCVIYPGVSIGVAVYPDTATSAEALLQSSDKSMYQMKGMHYQSAAVTRWTGPGGKDGAIAVGRAPH